LPSGFERRFLAVTSADIDGDGLPDFVLLRDGRRGGAPLDNGSAEVIKGQANSHPPPTCVLADLDNNGSLDSDCRRRPYLYGWPARLHAACRAGGHYRALGCGCGWRWQTRFDRPLALDPGKPVQLINHGAKKYHWQVIRTRASKPAAISASISFGIGGEVEIRSGLLRRSSRQLAAAAFRSGRAYPYRRGAHRVAHGLVQSEFGCL